MSDVGFSDVGLLWKWVSAALGNVLDQAGHKSPTQVPQPPRALKKIYTGRVKRKHGVWCLEREEHARVSRGVFETEHGLQEREKERVCK